MLNFLNIESQWEHYKRQLAQNSPVETRAYSRDDRIYAMHYNGHDGEPTVSGVVSDAVGLACPVAVDQMALSRKRGVGIERWIG
jgi:hypothetical protein